MDLSLLQYMLPDAARFFNLAPETLLAYLIMICTLCNIVSRLIPDDVKGFMGVIRNVCTVLGLYVGNRVTRGVTVNDIAKSIVKPADAGIVDLAKGDETLIQEATTDPVTPAFPGLPARGADGKFVSPKALTHWMVPVLALAVMLTLGGCATLGTVGNTICRNETSARLGLELALTQAYTIGDPLKRTNTIRAIQASLNALDACHVSG